MARRGGTPVVRDKGLTSVSELEEARRMYELRLKGISLVAIAQTMKCSVSRVHGILQKYTRQELLPYVEEYRQMQMDRSEYLWGKLLASGRLEKGDPAAFNAGVNILRRMADITGSDAPTKLELSTKVDPKEIELHKLILEAKREARDHIRAIKGTVEPEDDDEQQEGDA